MDNSVVIKELNKGRDLVAHLRTLMCEPSHAMGLIEEIISSVSKAIDALESTEEKSEYIGKKRKSSACGRGGYRRRKMASQWKTIEVKTYNDEFSWRKYGQKMIHNSKFPRAYYRCTHRHDQGCEAARLVQQKEDNPSLYMITYIGKHSCTASTNIPSQFLLDYSNESSLISFGSNASNMTKDFIVPSSSLFSQKQETDEEVLSNLSSEIFSPELYELPSFYEETSGLYSNESGSDMTFLPNSFDFGDDMLSFDFDFEECHTNIKTDRDREKNH